MLLELGALPLSRTWCDDSYIRSHPKSSAVQEDLYWRKSVAGKVWIFFKQEQKPFASYYDLLFLCVRS